jgi:hypothetical protein
VTLGLSALVPTIAVGLAFGNVGRQSFAQGQALRGFLVCLAVAGLCWRSPVVRWRRCYRPCWSLRPICYRFL